MPLPDYVEGAQYERERARLALRPAPVRITLSAMDREPTALLAYGTLRPGGALHARYMAGRYDRKAEATVPGFDLYEPIPAGYFPYAWPATSGPETGWATRTIRATWFHFTAQDWPSVLSTLDRVEGYPTHYDRKIVQALTDEGETVNGWLYVSRDDPRDTCALIPGGDWRTRDPERVVR
jgi:gamma-glutamylcyclotransferase (GGCT)/AIG2-like uncharacterized protein YtfP